ncbi:hypothetical protein [Nocardioides aurantiacus]|uniref:DUF732 domain-containing protein n=1 Tax=Nocardioides aurantiacus TaxID=86796 RepID=A0A3N2CU43_9ACTN|nr:hypothetical protein [Nocardioides aurantiacus]ROR91053.1 hypothetical protein EDD33_1913 [Nocardioides aurantiacus]
MFKGPRLRVCLAVCGAIMFAGCGSESVSLEDETTYLKAIRTDVPSSEAYDDSDLVEMGEKVCADMATGPGVRLLKVEYADITADDREKLAYFALTEGCPEWSGSGD